MKAADVRGSARRLAVARAVLLGSFLLLAARAAHLSVLDDRGVRLGQRQQHTTLSLAPERGAILDRGGHELALSLDAPSVYALPQSLAHPERDAAALARALGRPTAEVTGRLRGRSSFVFLARWVSPETAERVKALDLRGVGIVPEPARVYPYRELAAPLVGFANIDGRGVRGIEQSQDDWLRGTPRRLPVERDGSGNLLVAHGDEDWHTAGGDVALTLDVAMQSDALLALREAVEQTGARGGVVVTLDPGTGDVLALAEAPGFDPNRFRELDYADTRSRAFLDALEPGSTLKAFLVAAALEKGAITPDDWIDCEEGSFQVPGKVIHDTHPHGILRSAEILTVSSNIGAVKIALALGLEAHVEMLRRFGFGSSTDSGFPDESAGLLRDADEFRPLDQATLAFGQGLSATPIQLAAATAALASGGVWHRPRLVAARRGPGAPDGHLRGAWDVLPTDSGHRVVSQATAGRLLEMLEGVTGPEGTGRRAALRGVRVAGKTGTAQKLDRESGTYSNSRFVAWFIGVAPADAPRLAIAVALDEPRRPHHTGGASAAPLFARVAAAQLARLGIVTEPEPAVAPVVRTAAAETVSPPETAGDGPARKPTTARVAPARPVKTARSEPAKTVSTEKRRPAVQEAAPPVPPLPELESLAGRVLLPDLRGLTEAQVRVVTERANLVVEISGSGRAVAQEPPPGSIVAAQGRVRVVCRPGMDPT